MAARGGYIKAPTGPRLGAAPYLDVLGKAVLTIGCSAGRPDPPAQTVS